MQTGFQIQQQTGLGWDGGRIQGGGFIGTQEFLALCCVIPLFGMFCAGKSHSLLRVQRWGCISSQESFSQSLGSRAWCGGSDQEKFCPEQRSQTLPVLCPIKNSSNGFIPFLPSLLLQQRTIKPIKGIISPHLSARIFNIQRNKPAICHFLPIIREE